MEMTPLDRSDNTVRTGDGATPQGRELSSTGPHKEETKGTVQVNPKDIVKREVPIDQTALTIAAMLRRADPNLDAQTAANLAKRLLEHAPPVVSSKKDDENERVGKTLDVSA